jgi:hypothetical protein
MIEPDELVNLAYDHTYGFGGYSVADQDVTLIQVPISVTLRSLEKYKWGLRPENLGRSGNTQL